MTNSRRKGANGERELAKILAERLGVQPKRNLGQWRDGGCDLTDIPFFAIEVKRFKGDSRHLHNKWWKQAFEQGGPFKSVVAYREDRKDWRCILLGVRGGHTMRVDISLDDFCEIAKEKIDESMRQ